MRLFLLVTTALLLAGCNPSLPNKAPVFEPIAGAVAVKLRLAAAPNTRAEFALGGQVLAPDTDPADGYSVVIDTLDFANGLHTLHVRILDGQGQELQTLEHSLLIKN